MNSSSITQNISIYTDNSETVRVSESHTSVGFYNSNLGLTLTTSKRT